MVRGYDVGMAAFQAKPVRAETKWFAGLGGKVADFGHSVHTERK